MKQGKVYNNDIYAGIISKLDDGSYEFEYADTYYLDTHQPAISLTLPKTQRKFLSKSLFSFFFNMLSEGANKKLQSKTLKIDEEDHFEFLLNTAASETIGSIRVEAIKHHEKT